MTENPDKKHGFSAIFKVEDLERFIATHNYFEIPFDLPGEGIPHIPLFSGRFPLEDLPSFDLLKSWKRFLEKKRPQRNGYAIIHIAYIPAYPEVTVWFEEAK